jgi:hypothetical protein
LLQKYVLGKGGEYYEKQYPKNNTKLVVRYTSRGGRRNFTLLYLKIPRSAESLAMEKKGMKSTGYQREQ